MVYDAMRGAPGITSDGRLLQESFGVVKYLILPTAGFMINAIIFLSMLPDTIIE